MKKEIPINWHRVRRGRVRKSDTLLYHGFPQVLDHHTGLCISTAERNGYKVIRRNSPERMKPAKKIPKHVPRPWNLLGITKRKYLAGLRELADALAPKS